MSTSSQSSSKMLKAIRSKARLSQANLAQRLGTSFVSIDRWERGASEPSPAQEERIRQLYETMVISPSFQPKSGSDLTFLSRSVRSQLPLFDTQPQEVHLSNEIQPPILSRLLRDNVFATNPENAISQILSNHENPAKTVLHTPRNGMSAGKNTYTYDAHTYHTKVPPQGIAELITHYLPDGGLVLDPFAGSGMTGVAARAKGYDCILSDLAPAACFIADRFVSSIDPLLLEEGTKAILEELKEIRRLLYTTQCRECGRDTEILYTVWSYRVVCQKCSSDFLLWDHCRKYGRVVREHKILTQFPCPNCGITIKKSSLPRTTAHPVMLGYKCCGSRQQEITHPLTAEELEYLNEIERNPPLAEGFYPTTLLQNGVNLRQPMKHGFDSVDKFYTPRNLAAMSHLWRAIHRVEDRDLAAYLAFTFTSLYQRVTRFSEFRFWGGSGNTARFNVPYIYNEANVFVTFSRKAKSIQDHLTTTAAKYRGKTAVVLKSATSLDHLPDESVDLIFTDPPFGANINYSEMNILWEAWLGSFTDKTEEAIMNKFQNKGIQEYQSLMTQSLRECHRVLRSGHWLLLVFMNSSSEVWKALKTSITDAGFTIQAIDTFDKQHGTFKQFVSENTAGLDLVLHCIKHSRPSETQSTATRRVRNSVSDFLAARQGDLPTTIYLHVGRQEEIDCRQLFSEWLSASLVSGTDIIDFAQFREIVLDWLRARPRQ